MAYAASGGRCPAEQGLYGIFEVFADTLVICTLTGLSLLMSGIPIPYGTAGTAALNAQALGSVYGPRLGPVFLALSTALFALATILSWSFYGLRCWEYLLGSRSLGLYRGLYILACLGGAVLGPEAVWVLGETLNGLMCLPNLIALLVLSPRVGELARGRKKNLSGTWKPAAPFGIIKQR
jgi:AGCS family alanine or glycine:cation symporter